MTQLALRLPGVVCGEALCRDLVEVEAHVRGHVLYLCFACAEKLLLAALEGGVASKLELRKKGSQRPMTPTYVCQHCGKTQQGASLDRLCPVCRPLVNAPPPAPELRELEADMRRMGRPETGIPVRARLGEQWGSYDIAHLKRESLVAWLNSRPELALRTLLMLLGHEP